MQHCPTLGTMHRRRFLAAPAGIGIAYGRARRNQGNEYTPCPGLRGAAGK